MGSLRVQVVTFWGLDQFFVVDNRSMDFSWPIHAGSEKEKGPKESPVTMGPPLSCQVGSQIERLCGAGGGGGGGGGGGASGDKEDARKSEDTC